MKFLILTLLLTSTFTHGAFLPLPTATQTFGALPTMPKGAIVASDGVNNGQQLACANGEILEWDSTETAGVKCVSSGGGSTYLGNVSLQTANCSSNSNIGGTWALFLEDSDCNGAHVVTGTGLSAPATWRLGVIVDAPVRTDGYYKFTLKGGAFGKDCKIALSDNGTSYPGGGAWHTSVASAQIGINFTYIKKFTATTAVTVYPIVDSDTFACGLDTAAFNGSGIDVEFHAN